MLGSEVCDLADCPELPGGDVAILYNTDSDIAGFQFGIEGVENTTHGHDALEMKFAIPYLNKRNLSDETIKFFKLGFSSSSKQTLYQFLKEH